MKRILFVCLGNICRSPIAQGVADNLAKMQTLPLHIDSAGTSRSHEGEAPCINSIKIASKYGIDISQQYSRPIQTEDIGSFDYVVAMDRQNKKDLEAFGFENVYLLGDFGTFDGADVPDPYYFNGLEGFEKVFDMIHVCVENFLTHAMSKNTKKGVENGK
ncbi:MAG: hypothetical protein RLZZ428_588 [Pseudomonadota bacterium]|jgi:protein-tyrosine phosphatase